MSLPQGLFLPSDGFNRHLYMIGMSGMGKSKLIEALVLQQINLGHGVAVFDPHGDLFDSLCGRIGLMGRDIWQRVIIIDPAAQDIQVNLNPLACREGETAQFRANFLASAVSKIFSADLEVTARMHSIMYHAFWTLSAAGLTLVEAERLLTNKEYRAEVLQALALPSDHPLVNYWGNTYPKSQNEAAIWAQSTINKIEHFYNDPRLAAYFGQGEEVLDFRKIMDEQGILLINLNKPDLTENPSRVVGALLLAQLQLAAMSRKHIPERMRHQFTVFCDEFHTYATDEIATILAETRKYRMSLVLAHQDLGQFEGKEKLQKVVHSMVENLMVFRIGHQDAEMLVKDIFTPEIDMVKALRHHRVPTGISWFPFLDEYEPVYRSLNEIWELVARKLSLLPERKFWFKRRGTPNPILLQTPNLPNLPDHPRLPELIQRLRAVVNKQNRFRLFNPIIRLPSGQQPVDGEEWVSNDTL